MLRHLHIENMVLVELADIPFETGLNVISGETGSGKSALILAISLVLGDRANANTIRAGEEKAVVEAVFDISSFPPLNSLLEQSGIEVDPNEDLVVRRELFTNGKNRCFVQNRAASLGLVRQIGNFLIRFVGQHSNQALKETSAHRSLVDVFANLQPDIASFQSSWKKLKELRTELEKLQSGEAFRLREMEALRNEIEDIRSADLKAGEEEPLFEEYCRLSNSEEISTEAAQLLLALQDGEGAVGPSLHQLKQSFDKLTAMDGTFREISEGYRQIVLEFREIVHSLQQYCGNTESNPYRCEELNQRLSLIAKLKKKYGQSVEEVLAYADKGEQRLEKLESLDFSEDVCKKRLAEIEHACAEAALLLTQKRKEAARRLQTLVEKELGGLNMAKSTFEIRFLPQERSEFGDDRVEMFLAPNVGEKCLPLKDCASGGELSRVMMALQTLLAGKDIPLSIVFDEIDANIGGETATAVGEKLRQIGSGQQVICITHFPQVALLAHHHIQIRKEEENGRTLTHVKLLSEKERGEEIERMAGGITLKRSRLLS